MRALLLIVMAAATPAAFAGPEPWSFDRLLEDSAERPDLSLDLPVDPGWGDSAGRGTDGGIVLVPTGAEKIDFGVDRRYNPVPAPGSVVLLGAGAATLLRRRRSGRA